MIDGALRSNRRILVVDDDPSVCRTMSRQLGSLFRVSTAESYSEALSQLEQDTEIRALVSDCRMGPGPSGPELIREVNERFPHVQRIVVSANLKKEEREVLLKTGLIYRAFEKPWDHQELVDALTEVCGDEPARPGKVEGQRAGEKKLLFVGTSRLPANVSPEGVNIALTVELAVGAESQKILQVACTNAPKLSEEYLMDLLEGRKMPDGLVQALDEIRKSMFSDTRKQLIAGFQDLLRKYKMYQQEFGR